MLNIQNITLGSIVSFELFGEAILGTARRNVKVLGILDAQDASRYMNPATMHAAVFNSLPADTPNDFQKYPYLKIKLGSGETEAIGLPWIRENSYQEVSLTDLQLTIPNVSPERRQLLMEVLAANGFESVNVIELN